MKRTKSKRSRKSAKNKTRANRKKMRGGCGCGRSMLGGSAGLNELPARYYYDLRDEAQNPNYMKGGKKMKGGMPSFLIPGYSNITNDVTVQPITNGRDKFYA